MSAILDDLFTVRTGENSAEVRPYSDLLDKVVSSCPGANLVLESQQWSRQAAIQQGNCSIHAYEAFAGDTLPFDPSQVAVQITYVWDSRDEQFELAWVATWPHDDD